MLQLLRMIGFAGSSAMIGPPMPHARKLKGARHTSCDSGTMCRRGCVPAAYGNRILTIFAPYTFSHSARVTLRPSWRPDQGAFLVSCSFMS
jgi:hypothetical protein